LKEGAKMMYKSNVACCIKVGGKVLREQGDVVHLPFGSEYSVFVRNMNSVRAQFTLTIDGQDQTDDTWIVIQPNSSVELERSIKNNNWNSGNRFKFIERTAAVEKHRGIDVEDGLVRIQFQKEFVQQYIPVPIPQPYYVPTPIQTPYVWPDRRRWPAPPWERRRGPVLYKSLRSSGIGGSSMGTTTTTTPTSFVGQCINFADTQDCYTTNSSVNETGVTVPGSISNQQFVHASSFATEHETHVMILHLKGSVTGKAVKRPITVKTKLRCITCGKVNKGAARFCAGCGTALTIIA
jgi:hypothetical protein